MVVPIFSEVLDEVLPIEAGLTDSGGHGESLIEIFGIFKSALDELADRFVP